MSNGLIIENGILKKYNRSDPEVTIPNGVTSIGERAFENCTSIERIILPNGVKEVGKYAFSMCTNLFSIKLPDSLTIIENGAFKGCKCLNEISLPKRITYIGDSAFAYCKSIRSIEIPNSVSSIEVFTFGFCENLISIKIPDSITTIGHESFDGCKSLSELIIPNSVTKIGYIAFDNCPNLSIICNKNSISHKYCLDNHIPFIFDFEYKAFHGIIPKGIERIASPFLADEEKPFVFISYSHKDRDRVLETIKTLYENGWKIWYDEGLTVGDRYDETIENHVEDCSAFLLFVTGNSLKSDYIKEYEIPWAKKYDRPIIKCILDEGTDYEIDGGLVKATVSRFDIESAFEITGSLKKGEKREAKGISLIINPSDRNEETKNESFAYCIYSKESEANSKTIILEAEESGCSIYNAVEFGNDKEKLEESKSLIVFIDKAFLADKNLTELVEKEFKAGRDITVCQIEEITEDDLPEGLKKLYKYQWLDFAHGFNSDTNTELARHLQKVGCCSIDVIPGFEYVKTDEGIIITRYTGKSPSPKLESEYGGIPVIKIGEKAFENCIRIERIIIPDSIIDIGESAFLGCTNLKSITLTQSINELNNYVFSNCVSLNGIIIPDHVKIIGWSAFKGCTRLDSIVIPNGVIEIGSNSFFDCNNLTSITVPDSVKEIGDNAFSGCKDLTINCSKGSFAEKYAILNDIMFKVI